MSSAGTTVSRMISASVRIATASSRPNSLLMRSGVSMNAMNTADMMIAAANTTWPIAPTPSLTASFVALPWMCSSRIRLIRKTS